MGWDHQLDFNHVFSSSICDLIYEMWICSTIFVALKSVCWPVEAGVVFDFHNLQVQQVVVFTGCVKAEYWNAHGVH